MLKDLANFVRSESAATGRLFRSQHYGRREMRRFLRDVLALANAAVDTPRYLVTGADFNENGQKFFNPVPDEDFELTSTYLAKAATYIEPPVRIEHHRVLVDDIQVGVFEISSCNDKPYMMRADHCERLRRGDAFAQVDAAIVKLGRSQLQEMFEARFADSLSAERIDVGFPGEILHKTIDVPTVDLDGMPSFVEGAKLRELIDVRRLSKGSSSASAVARLTHARLFGADDPYDTRSTAGLIKEADDVQEKREADDRRFLYETHGQKLQIAVTNHGGEALRDVSLMLVLPAHDELFVAEELSCFADAENPVQLGDYPAISRQNGGLQISAAIGELAANVPVDIFAVPPRYCAGRALAGRKIAIRYRLSASNLRTPAEGKLRLRFVC